MTNRYIATFPTGAQEVVTRILSQQLTNVQIEDLCNNLVVFSSTSPNEQAASLLCLNNVFLLMGKFGSSEMQDFDRIVDWITQRGRFQDALGQYLQQGEKQKYRIYFFQDTKSISLPSLQIKLKNWISRRFGLQYSAGAADIEVWVIRRKEGFSTIGVRLTKKQDYQQVLPPGELRPEVAYILAWLAKPKYTDVVLDPFCGHGAIPKAMLDNFQIKKVIASDLNIGKFMFRHPKLEIHRADFTALDFVADNSVDKIVTDPPWGIADGTNLDYLEVFNVLRSKLTHKGIAVVLLHSEIDVHNPTRMAGLEVNEAHDIIVGGKWAKIYVLVKVPS